jgi:hypothetical protein
MSNMNKRISEVAQGVRNDFKKTAEHLNGIKKTAESNKTKMSQLMGDVESIKEAIIQMVPIVVQLKEGDDVRNAMIASDTIAEMQGGCGCCPPGTFPCAGDQSDVDFSEHLDSDDEEDEDEDDGDDGEVKKSHSWRGDRNEQGPPRNAKKPRGHCPGALL